VPGSRPRLQRDPLQSARPNASTRCQSVYSTTVPGRVGPPACAPSADTDLSWQLVGGTLRWPWSKPASPPQSERSWGRSGPFASGDRTRAGRPVPPLRHLARPALAPSGRQLPPCRPGRHLSAPAALQLQLEIRQRVQRHRLHDGQPRQPEPAGRSGACRLRAAPGRRIRRGGGGSPRANRAQGPVCATSTRPDVDRGGGTGPGACTFGPCSASCLRTASPFQNWSTRSGATWSCAIWPSPATG